MAWRSFCKAVTRAESSMLAIRSLTPLIEINHVFALWLLKSYPSVSASFNAHREHHEILFTLLVSGTWNLLRQVSIGYLVIYWSWLSRLVSANLFLTNQQTEAQTPLYIIVSTITPDTRLEKDKFSHKATKNLIYVIRSSLQNRTRTQTMRVGVCIRLPLDKIKCLVVRA